MSKFNLKQSIKTVNNCGQPAYKMADKEKLVSQVLTSFFNESKFYGDNSEDMQKTIVSVIKSDPEFVSKLAIFARRVFNMRSVAHVLTAYLAHENEGKPFVRKTVRGVTVRGDDVTEIMAFYIDTFGKRPVPNSLKKGINDVLVNFDEYTLAKYKGDNKSVKMRDLICMCRPSPKTPEQSDMWKRCIEGNLKTPVTWETELSKNGNNKETWEKLIDSGKVGYMAYLRNLRNILQAEPSNLQTVLDVIQDPVRVKKSKQLPFRYLSAYKAVSDIAGSKVFDVLENALEVSVENMPKLSGTTVIAVDVSGSMSGRISRQSDIMYYEIAVLLGLVANKICDNSIFYTFDTEIRKFDFSSKTPILETIRNIPYGGGTNMYLPFKEMMDKKIKADRIIILSDNECNRINWYSKKTVQQMAYEYRKQTNQNLWVHAIDLVGYGTQQFHGNRTNIIAGWSEKVLDFIQLSEQGTSSLIKTIEDCDYIE